MSFSDLLYLYKKLILISIMEFSTFLEGPVDHAGFKSSILKSIKGIETQKINSDCTKLNLIFFFYQNPLYACIAFALNCILD